MLCSQEKIGVFRLRDLQRKKNLMENLDKFYENKKNFDTLVEVLSKDSKISLRALEFTASNELSCKTNVDNLGKYQDSLDVCSKLLFDSFRRHESYEYTHCSGKSVTTNTAQLSFLKFCIENGVIDFLQKGGNMEMVEKMMKKSVQKNIKVKSSKKRRRRKKKLLQSVGEAQKKYNLE